MIGYYDAQLYRGRREARPFRRLARGARACEHVGEGTRGRVRRRPTHVAGTDQRHRRKACTAGGIVLSWAVRAGVAILCIQKKFFLTF